MIVVGHLEFELFEELGDLLSIDVGTPDIGQFIEGVVQMRLVDLLDLLVVVVSIVLLRDHRLDLVVVQLRPQLLAGTLEYLHVLALRDNA